MAHFRYKTNFRVVDDINRLLLTVMLLDGTNDILL